MRQRPHMLTCWRKLLTDRHKIFGLYMSIQGFCGTGTHIQIFIRTYLTSFWTLLGFKVVVLFFLACNLLMSRSLYLHEDNVRFTYSYFLYLHWLSHVSYTKISILHHFTCYDQIPPLLTTDYHPHSLHKVCHLTLLEGLTTIRRVVFTNPTGCYS